MMRYITKKIQFEVLEMAHFHDANKGPQRHIACDPCRRSKVRCDGGKPFCKRCGSSLAAWECSYTRASAKKGRPRKRGVDPRPQSRTLSISSASGTSPSSPGCQDEVGSLITDTPQSISPSIFAGQSFTSGDDGFNILCHDAAVLTWSGEPLALITDDETTTFETTSDRNLIKDTKFADMAIEGFQTALQVGVAPPDCLPRELTETLYDLFETPFPKC